MTPWQTIVWLTPLYDNPALYYFFIKCRKYSSNAPLSWVWINFIDFRHNGFILFLSNNNWGFFTTKYIFQCASFMWAWNYNHNFCIFLGSADTLQWRFTDFENTGTFFSLTVYKWWLYVWEKLFEVLCLTRACWMWVYQGRCRWVIRKNAQNG